MFAGVPAQRTYAPLHFRNVRFIPPPAAPDEPPRFSLLADVRLHAVGNNCRLLLELQLGLDFFGLKVITTHDLGRHYPRSRRIVHTISA